MVISNYWSKIESELLFLYYLKCYATGPYVKIEKIPEFQFVRELWSCEEVMIACCYWPLLANVGPDWLISVLPQIHETVSGGLYKEGTC